MSGGLIIFLEALLDSKKPVIMGIPPPADSKETHGRRRFLNGTVDRKGHSRLTGGSAKTTVRPAIVDKKQQHENAKGKGKARPASPTEVSDDSVEHRGKGKTCADSPQQVDDQTSSSLASPSPPRTRSITAKRSGKKVVRMAIPAAAFGDNSDSDDEYIEAASDVGEKVKVEATPALAFIQISDSDDEPRMEKLTALTKGGQEGLGKGLEPIASSSKGELEFSAVLLVSNALHSSSTAIAACTTTSHTSN